MAQLSGIDYSTFLSRAAEVETARAAYANLNDRLDSFVLAGGNTATLTNGAAAAGQKNVTVDSATGFIVSGRVAYMLAGGAMEYNSIASIGAPTTITLTTNIGTGGIGDNTLFTMISESEYQAAQAINHSGSLTLPSAMQYAAGNIYNVQAYSVSPANSAATNSANLQSLIDLAASSGPGIIFFPYATSTYDFAKVGTSGGGVNYAVSIPAPAGSLWFVGNGARLRTTGVVNSTASTHFCLFLVEAQTAPAAKANIHWQGLDFEGTNIGVVAGLASDNRAILIFGNYVTDCTVENCTARHFYYAGFAVFGAGKNNAIRHCRAYENGENGINWNCGAAGQIIANRCWGNVSGGIEASVIQTTVANNSCWDNLRGLAIGGFTLAVSGGARGNIITNNAIHDNIQSGLYLATGTEYSLISGNTVYRNGDYGMVIAEDLASYPGVYTRYNLVRNNFVYGNANGGIYLSAVGNMIYDNIVIPGNESGFAQAIGINLNSTYCENSHVVGNFVVGHTANDYIIGNQNNLTLNLTPAGSSVSINSAADVAYDIGRALRTEVASGATYTLPPSAALVWVFSSPTTITLPSAAKYPAGLELVVKDKQGTAGTNTITIQCAGSDVIESSGGSITITTNYGCRRLISDGGSNWYIVGTIQ